MIQFEVNGVRYIGVEVPEGTVQLSMLMHQLWGRIPPNQGITRLNILPAGNYEIVGLAGKLTGKELVNVLPQYDFMTCPISDIEDYITELQKITQLPKNTLILKIKENE